jgi:hypothetical protein
MDDVMRYGAWQREHHEVMHDLRCPFSNSWTASSMESTPPTTKTPAYDGANSLGIGLQQRGIDTWSKTDSK